MKYSFVYEKEKFVGEGSCVFGDLKITRECVRYGEAEYSRLTFENVGERDTGILSNICDIDDVFCFPEDELRPGFSVPEKFLRVYNMHGSVCSREDFSPENRPLPCGGSLQYRAAAGRSSEACAPFFDLNRGEEGVMLAVGWSGQWFCDFERGKRDVRVRAGVPGLAFYLKPGEKVRTASILYFRYQSGQNAAHNRLRAILKERAPSFAERPVPLSLMAWGGADTAAMLADIAFIKENAFPYDALWIDAGWYGVSPLPCGNAFEGDWSMHTGDWRVNPHYHPDGLKEVAAAARAAGLELILWLEPERVVTGTPHISQHPEMYLHTRWAVNENLLDLGREDAQEYFIETVSHFVDTLGITWLRQDFNMDPLPLWNKYDAEGRRGITQLKYIEGLYRVWDRIAEKYPALRIDNCAAGGRRIDIETLSRTVPLWRSDCNSTYDAAPEIAQNHNIGLSWWVPYSGTSTGIAAAGSYRFRSCHAAAMVNAYMETYGRFPVGEEISRLRASLEEYRAVRGYYSCDFYPVFGFGTEDARFSGWQFHDPARGAGVLAVFRRPGCLSDSAVVPFEGLDPSAEYEISGDAGATVHTGRSLLRGLRVRISKQGGSALLEYHKREKE